jgi:hypothetical protein
MWNLKMRRWLTLNNIIPGRVVLLMGAGVFYCNNMGRLRRPTKYSSLPVNTHLF